MCKLSRNFGWPMVKHSDWAHTYILIKYPAFQLLNLQKFFEDPKKSLHFGKFKNTERMCLILEKKRGNINAVDIKTKLFYSY